jgi:hypothetical protein
MPHLGQSHQSRRVEGPCAPHLIRWYPGPVHMPRWTVRLHLPANEYASRVALVEALAHLEPWFDPAHNAVEVIVAAADTTEAATYVRRCRPEQRSSLPVGGHGRDPPDRCR